LKNLLQLWLIRQVAPKQPFVIASIGSLSHFAEAACRNSFTAHARRCGRGAVRESRDKCGLPPLLPLPSI